MTGSFFIFPIISATSVDVEEHLYQLANKMGITVVTTSQVSNQAHFCCVSPSTSCIHHIHTLLHMLGFSQRPALIPFHSLELRLIDGEGKWELRSIEH